MSERTRSNSTPMHIVVFVTSWGQPSETFVRREVDAAIDAGHRVSVLSMRAQVGVAHEPLTVHHLRWWQVVSGFSRAALRAPRKVLRHLALVLRRSSGRNVLRHLGAGVLGIAFATRVRDADIAHAHFAWLAASAADGFAAVSDVPLSIFPHAFDVFESDKVDAYLLSKLNRAAVVAVESETMARDMLERFECGAEVVRIGVPAEWVRTSPRRPASGTPHVLSVGMLRHKKGHDVLLRALARCPGVRATIVGEGPERQKLTSLARELGIDGRVDLVGLRTPEDVMALLDEAHLFCLASRTTATGDRDGVPNVLIEALARSVPSVSTHLSGIPDLLSDGRGVMVAPEDPDALASAIASLLADPLRAAAMGTRGWSHVRAQYVAEENWQRLEHLFSSVAVTR